MSAKRKVRSGWQARSEVQMKGKKVLRSRERVLQKKITRRRGKKILAEDGRSDRRKQKEPQKQ